MKIAFFTIAMLAIVFGLALRQPQSETDRELAEKLLESEEVQKVKLSDTDGPPAFQSGSRTALFFEGDGMQGLIRGVIVIEGDRVIDLRIIQSREGLDHDALDTPNFRSLFHEGPAKPPFNVDAVSGATISSQAVKDAVNDRLKQWVKYIQKEENNPPPE